MFKVKLDSTFRVGYKEKKNYQEVSFLTGKKRRKLLTKRSMEVF